MFAAVDASAYDGSRKFLFIFFQKDPQSPTPTIGIMSVRSKKYLSRRYGKKIQTSSHFGGNETINIQTSIWKITKKGSKSTDPFFFKKDSRNRHILCAGMKEYATPLHMDFQNPGRVGKISSQIAKTISISVSHRNGDDDSVGSSDDEDDERERVTGKGSDRQDGSHVRDDKGKSPAESFTGIEKEKGKDAEEERSRPDLTVDDATKSVAAAIVRSPHPTPSPSPSPSSSLSPPPPPPAKASGRLSTAFSPRSLRRLLDQDAVLLHGMVREWLMVVGDCTQSDAEAATSYLLSSSLGIQCWTDLYFLDSELIRTSGLCDDVTCRLVSWIDGHRSTCMRDMGNIHGWLTSSLQLPPHTADKYLALLTGEDVGITTFDDLFYLDDDLLRSIGIGVIHRRKMLCWLQMNSKDERRCILATGV
jgi:hypothetical protein